VALRKCVYLSGFFQKNCIPIASAPSQMRLAMKLKIFGQTFLMCLLSAVACNTSLAETPQRTIAQFKHTPWGEKEGAPKDIRAIAQTKDGYLWLASANGLFRFDGITFEHYEPQSGPALPVDSVRALVALPDGDLWIGSSSGTISHLRNGQAKTYTRRDGVPEGKVCCLTQDRQGAIWAGTSTGLARFVGGRWEEVGKEWNFNAKSTNALFLDDRGTLWVATENTIAFLPSGARSFQSTSIHVGQVLQLTESPNGKLWMAETTRSIRPVPLGDKLPPSDGAEIASGSQGILFSRDGDMWVTTLGDGLARIRAPEQLKGNPVRFASSSRRFMNGKRVVFSKAIQRFTAEDGLTDDVAKAIFQDREGNIWVGTANGLDQFRKNPLIAVSLPFADRNPILVPGHHGGVWAFLRERVFHIGESRTDEVTNPGDNVKDAYLDSAGALWWINGEGLVRFENGKTFRYPLPRELPNPFVYKILATLDRSGRLWIAAEHEGLFFRDNGVWSRFPTPPELAKLIPETAFTDNRGRVWFGYAGGTVANVNEGKIENLSARLGPPVGNVWAINGRNGHIWIGGDSGLALFDGSKFRAVIPADEPKFIGVSGIAELADGSLWLCASRGVIFIDRAEVQRALETPSYHVHYELFDSLDGLPGDFHNVGKKLIQENDGRLWFGTSRGLAWLKPADISADRPLTASVWAIISDGKVLAPVAGLNLPPLTRSLRFNYSALDLSIPQRVRMRYRLEGADKAWEDDDGRRSAFYLNLGPGKYRFHVNARDEGGEWNPADTALEFTIAPAWFQTNWFFALCAFAASLIVWALYWMRVRQVSKAMAARFDERLSERSRIARSFHDTILQTIQGSKLVADSALKQSSDPARMRGALEQLSVWLGRVTDESRAALESLRTSTKETNDLAEAFQRTMEECRINSPMAATFSVVGEVSEMHPVVRDEVYRIGCEAIRNASVHSHATHLQVELAYAEDLILRVHDNGVGIDPAIVDKGKEGHFGLQGMHERARRIMARFTIDTSTLSGTAIKLIVPGGIVYRGTVSDRRKQSKIKSLLERMGLTSKSADS
jgi:signal transduction histidine kinase/ligand-binding sensor domain-containing protein